MSPIKEPVPASGSRLVQIRVPDAHSPAFAEEAHRQSLTITQTKLEEENQAFIDAVSEPLEVR